MIAALVIHLQMTPKSNLLFQTVLDKVKTVSLNMV